jgi:hypothetical protein
MVKVAVAALEQVLLFVSISRSSVDPPLITCNIGYNSKTLYRYRRLYSWVRLR